MSLNGMVRGGLGLHSKRWTFVKQVRAFASSSKLGNDLSWATVDPFTVSAQNPHKMLNLVGGKWKESKQYVDLVDPMNGEPFMKMPDTQLDESNEFVESLRKCKKSGLHNPLKNPERYNMYADICFKAARALHEKEVEEFFIKCIQRVMPKSYAQAYAEVRVTRTFLETFAGDGVRFMARGFSVSGDHAGQESRGYRWPYGPVAIVAPFNFPFEIPVLQLMGALFMGNKAFIKGAPQVSMVVEQYLRLLHYCGMPMEDVDMLHGFGDPTQHVITNTPVRLTQFTGSSGVAHRLLKETGGKVKIEDAGFDWKIVGPDIGKKEVEYVAWVCDQDAYACSGQKCSAQSALFVHKNAVQAGLLEHMKKLAERRNLTDLTIGPVLTWSNERISNHMNSILDTIKGSKVLFGGKPLDPASHKIPKQYGSYEPTAVFVPFDEMMKNEKNFELATTELFGPFQIVVEFDDSQIELVLEACEKMSHHLTAGVVSSDQDFVHHMLSNTVNGTTYAGIRARTTGAPTNHWFGPAGDPNGAGIGTPEAIRLVWSCHREIVKDVLSPPKSWTLPASS